MGAFILDYPVYGDPGRILSTERSWGRSEFRDRKQNAEDTARLRTPRMRARFLRRSRQSPLGHFLTLATEAASVLGSRSGLAARVR